MLKLSEHFTSDEFACKCGCGFDSPDPNLIFVLECLRTVFNNKPITINSGCRCKFYNAKIKGTKNSQHLHGKAADIVIKDVLASHVAEKLRGWFYGSCGIGDYYTFTHFDIREKLARW